ncbi:MAG: lytic transglycosylase domain-containing protein [Defluviitaleaceae bacterium]|nr:lytic transglycosylase domain-containing protein [Defluviitaleaceae bacterium]
MLKRNRSKILLSLIFFAILTCIVGIILVQIRFPIRHLDVIKANAGNFEPAFILAVIHAESSFRPYVVSHRGAMGLMQIMEPTGIWLAQLMGKTDFEADQLFVPETNIVLGTYFLNWLWRYYDGDITLILSGYNAGIGNVNRWLGDERFSKDGETLYYIPFWETRTYVQRVERNRQIYEWLLKIYGLFS